MKNLGDFEDSYRRRKIYSSEGLEVAGELTVDTQAKKYGYSYHVTLEQIEAYQKLPVKERLRWLEEAREFMASMLTPEQWETMQKFRRGEI